MDIDNIDNFGSARDAGDGRFLGRGDPWDLGAAVGLRPVTLVEAERLMVGKAVVETEPDWHPEYPLTETVTGLRLLLATHRALGWTGLAVPMWWMHQIVVAGHLVGDIGFHGPPQADGPAVVEIGYDVVPALRGRGIATAACRQILALAWRDGAAAVEAETEPDNPYGAASARVLASAGFTQEAGGRWRVRRPDGIGWSRAVAEAGV